MTYYVLQVITRGEGKFLRIARTQLEEFHLSFLWPRRNLRIRRQGIWRNSLAPIFPGYIFIESEGITPGIYWAVKRVPGFIRFLKDNEHIEPLTGRDRELLMHFLSFGEVVDRSLVSFDENNRIRVISGPLRGLEGRIIRVDRRKGRARVELDMYQESFQIDFGFESIERTPEQRASGPAARA